MTKIVILILATCAVGLARGAEAVATMSQLNVSFLPGVTGSSRLSHTWLTMIEDRHSQRDFEVLKNSIEVTKREEKDWIDFLHKIQPEIIIKFKRVASVVPTNLIPSEVKIVYANRGGNDGFTWKTQTIGIDLSDWVKAYGSPTENQNQDRAIRILTHEFTHLITRKYRDTLAANFSNNSYQRALWTLYHEGLGTYWSLSSQWVSAQGVLTDKAVAALKALEPILKERLHLLYKDDGSNEFELRKGISGGKFSDRWGALTIALWISQETKRKDKEFGEWLLDGPEAVESLLKRRLKLFTQ